MTSRVGWKSGLVGVGAFALIALGLFSLASSLRDERHLRDRLTARLAAWTGGTVEIFGGTRLSYFPVITIHAGSVRIDRADRIPGLRKLHTKSLRAELGLWSLLVSSEPEIRHLALTEPQIELDTNADVQEGARAGAQGPPLVRLLRSAPTARLTLADGTLHLTGARGAEALAELSADLAIDATGAASGEAAFSWRGERVSLSLRSGTPTIVASTAKSPVRVEVASAIVEASIEGDATITDAMQMHGELELNIPDLRRFSKWMGLLVPDGAGLGAFKAAGAFNWHGQRISFDDGSFSLDGTKALGVLAVKYAGPRPAIEGTLALDTLDLSPYLAGARPAAASGGARKDQAVRLDFPILHHLDVDLRVSTAQIRSASLTLGQSAFSVSLKSGKLAADFAVLELCGGRGNGRLELNAALPLPRFDVSATVTGASAQACMKPFGASPLEGMADLALKLTSEGRNSRELLERLGGNLTLSMSSGQAHVDLAKVLAMARKRELRGWASVAGTPTRFDSLTAEFELDKGSARSESFKMRSGKTTITGRGTIDLASRQLNCRFVLSNRTAERIPRLRALVAKLVDALVISGPLWDPTIRLVRHRAGTHATGTLRAALP